MTFNKQKNTWSILSTGSAHLMVLAKPKSIHGQTIIQTNHNILNEVKTKLTYLVQSNISLEEKKEKLDLLQVQTPDISITHTVLLAEFTHIINSNQAQLEYQLNQQKQQNAELQKDLQRILQNQDEDIKKNQLKEAKKLKRLNRQRQPSKQPFLIDYYKKLIKMYNKHSYVALRNRIAFTVLAITGISFSELFSIRISQIKTLCTKGLMPINRLKDRLVKKLTFRI